MNKPGELQSSESQFLFKNIYLLLSHHEYSLFHLQNIVQLANINNNNIINNYYINNINNYNNYCKRLFITFAILQDIS